ncbi:MAG: InlB B-repeat-containing protein [Oscillospiraceae bacterium]|nr:InlB B-repeat-containing protein [Oscillospiraceae bacterium]
MRKILAMIMAVCMLVALVPAVAAETTVEITGSGEIVFHFGNLLRGEGDDGVYGSVWNVNGMFGDNFTTVAAETVSYAVKGTRNDLTITNESGESERFLIADLGTRAWDGKDVYTGSDFKGVWTIEAYLGENAETGYYDVAIRGTKTPQSGTFDVYVDNAYAGEYIATKGGVSWEFCGEEKLGQVYITPDSNKKIKISFRCTNKGYYTDMTTPYDTARLSINSLSLTPSEYVPEEGVVKVDFGTVLRSATDDGTYVGSVKWPVTGIFGSNFTTVAAKSSTFSNNGTRIDLSSKNADGKYEKFAQLDLGRQPWSGVESDNLGRWTISVDMGENAKSGYYDISMTGTKLYSAGEFDVYVDGILAGSYSSNILDKSVLWVHGGEEKLGSVYITPDADSKVEVTFAVTKNGYYSDLTTPYETARIALNTLKMELVSEAPGEEIEKNISVYIDALSGGTVEKSTSEKITSVAPGTNIRAEAIADEGYVFSHWKDASGKFISGDAEYSFRPYVNTSIIAVFDKVTVAEGEEKEVYFFNGNGDFVTKKTTTENAISDIPEVSLAGYIFDMWTTDGKTAFDGSNIVKAVTRVVAKYKDEGKKYSGKVSFGSEEYDVVYDKSITFSDATAKVWKRNGKTVAYGTTYNHYIFDAAEISFETADADVLPVIVLDKHSTEDMYMIEYDIPEGFTKIETGILFGDSTHNTVGSCYYKAKSVNKEENATHGQFTAMKNDSGTYDQSVVRGYLIYTDGTFTNVVYAELN